MIPSDSGLSSVPYAKGDKEGSIGKPFRHLRNSNSSYHGCHLGSPRSFHPVKNLPQLKDRSTTALSCVPNGGQPALQPCLSSEAVYFEGCVLPNEVQHIVVLYQLEKYMQRQSMLILETNESPRRPTLAS